MASRGLEIVISANITPGRASRLRGIIAAMSRTPSILIDPAVQGGTPCFAGTRVPVKSLFDALSRGRSVDYLLEQFPCVLPEQVRDVLAQAEQLLRDHAPHAA
jgi:uncharacterized protein (DUF433 family)